MRPLHVANSLVYGGVHYAQVLESGLDLCRNLAELNQLVGLLVALPERVDIGYEEGHFGLIPLTV